MVGAQFKARELCMLRGAGLRSCVLDLGQGSKINSTPLKGCGTKEKQERLAHEIPGKSQPFICRYLSHFSNQFSICIHSKLDARLKLNAILSLAIPRPVVRSLSPVTFRGPLEYSRYIHIAKILAKSSLKR